MKVYIKESFPKIRRAFVLKRDHGANKIHFYKKSLAFGFTLKVRPFRTWKSLLWAKGMRQERLLPTAVAWVPLTVLAS